MMYKQMSLARKVIMNYEAAMSNLRRKTFLEQNASLDEDSGVDISLLYMSTISNVADICAVRTVWWTPN